MIYHLPERIYDYVKDNQKFKDAEAALKASGWQSSFVYTKERFENEYKLFFNMERAVMEAVKGAPGKIIREARIMMRCETAGYLKKQAEKDPDRENRLCCYYQLTNCGVNVEANKSRFLYEYGKATMLERAKFSSTMHNVAYIFKGEKAIAESSSVEDAVKSLIELRRKTLEVPCAYHDKLEKTTTVECIAHFFFTYCRFRNTITKEETDLLVDKCLNAQNWCGKVYDDVWLGNFRTTVFLYSVLLDRLQRNDETEFVQNAFHMLAGYLVSSFADRENTIKSLTTHNEDFRARYIVLVGACIRLLGFVDEDYVKENILPLAGHEEKLLAVDPMKDGDSGTPISDNIIRMLGQESDRTKSIQIFEREIRKGFDFLAKKS